MKQITPEIKAKIFALYIGQNIWGRDSINLHNVRQVDLSENYGWLMVSSLSSITDEDAIEVAKMAHQRFGSVWRIKRTNDLIHVESDGNVSDLYHISINPFCGSVNAHHHFLKTETNDRASYKVNVGSVNSSSKYVVGLYSIPDYLRSKGYALPYMNWSVEDLIAANVYKLKE